MVPGQKKGIEKDEEFVIAKTDFLLAVCRGFAGNLPADLRHIYVRDVCKKAGESLPTHQGVVLAVEEAAFYAATLRVGTPFAETPWQHAQVGASTALRKDDDWSST